MRCLISCLLLLHKCPCVSGGYVSSSDDIVLTLSIVPEPLLSIAVVGEVIEGGPVSLQCEAIIDQYVDNELSVTFDWLRNGAVFVNSSAGSTSDNMTYIGVVGVAVAQLGDQYGCYVTIEIPLAPLMYFVSETANLTLSTRPSGIALLQLLLYNVLCLYRGATDNGAT